MEGNVNVYYDLSYDLGFRAQVIHTLTFIFLSNTLSGTRIMYMNQFCKGCLLVWWGDPTPPQFDNTLDMKVFEKKKGSFYILHYLVELIIKNWWCGKKKIENLVNLGHFFHCVGQNHLFQLTSFKKSLDHVPTLSFILSCGV